MSKSEKIHVFMESEEDKADKDLGVEWTAPDTPGEITLWFVVDDGRGGIGWVDLKVQVGP